jgi:dTDP-4-amino-4,6-dideoxy-D-galactose acyltransferase
LRVEKDQWLSDVLEISSWKVLDIAGTPPADIRAGLLDRAGRGAAFFSAKIPTLDVGAVTNATGAGFLVVDANVTLDWDNAAGSAGGSVIDRNITIEQAGVDDIPAIEKIAGQCFTFSRFHLDPAIGHARANEVKRQWARNACRGRASVVYVARQSNDVTGFLAVLEASAGGRRAAIIDLVGVDRGHQGQGAGQVLSWTFVDEWRDRADRLRVGTQISNIPAMRLYEKIGFRITETSYVLHAHVKNGSFAV